MSPPPAERPRAPTGELAARYFGIPELKNPRYLACFKDGRRARIVAALAAGLDVALAPPFYSHHHTRQSLFNRGWRTITELELRIARGRPQATPSTPHPTHTGGHHGR